MAEPPLLIDFTAGAIAHRLRSGAGRGGALARAAGLRPGRPAAIVDATAGLGRDAFILASLGATVTLIERAPAVQAALAAALHVTPHTPPEIAAILRRMTLLPGDARQLLAGLVPQTILVDPMHPPRGNAALVKQPMRRLREIVGPDDDIAELLRAALAAATRRVVLKWPRRAPPVAGIRPPSHSIEGKTTRYDVFVCG